MEWTARLLTLKTMARYFQDLMGNTEESVGRSYQLAMSLDWAKREKHSVRHITIDKFEYIIYVRNAEDKPVFYMLVGYAGAREDEFLLYAQAEALLRYRDILDGDYYYERGN